ASRPRLYHHVDSSSGCPCCGCQNHQPHGDVAQPWATENLFPGLFQGEHMTTRWRLYRHHEAGSILVIAMVSLALLTVIGVLAITTGTLESDISGNEKTYQEAFYSAELGLVGGETIIETLPNRGALQEGVLPGRYASGALRWNATAFQLEKQ